MKNLLFGMLVFSCIAMMYGKIFVKPDQYHFVPDRGYLSTKEFNKFNRLIDAKDIADSVDDQIEIWYSTATEEIVKDDVNRMLESDVHEQTNYLESIDHYPVNSVNFGTRGCY